MLTTVNNKTLLITFNDDHSLKTVNDLLKENTFFCRKIQGQVVCFDTKNIYYNIHNLIFLKKKNIEIDFHETQIHKRNIFFKRSFLKKEHSFLEKRTIVYRKK